MRQTGRTVTSVQQALRDNIATVLRVRRPIAWRIVRWLRERLHEQLGVVHGEAGVVPFRSATQDVGVLVATVDYLHLEVGCAWCGEFIASQGEALVEKTKAIVIDPQHLPRELQAIGLRPAALYCAECWDQYADHLRERYDAVEVSA